MFFVYIKKRRKDVQGWNQESQDSELNLARDVKKNKEGFFRYIG